MVAVRALTTSIWSFFRARVLRGIFGLGIVCCFVMGGAYRGIRNSFPTCTTYKRHRREFCRFGPGRGTLCSVYKWRNNLRVQTFTGGMCRMSLMPASSLLDQPANLPKSIFDYDVIDFVGEGAASLIYAVSDPKSKQLYALKHVVRKTEKDARFIEQLENEYEVGKRVVHPNLRRIFECKVNRSLFMKVNEAILLMELFDGTPLEVSLPRSLTALVQVFIETARALEALHKLGYVHCDLKPSNILINNAGHVKVIDLGQACPNGTAKKRIQGTPDYIAPEQVKCLPVSYRTDIFNFGATMYWALCGRKMPTLFTAGKGENSILSDDLIPSPRQLNPMVPETLSNFVMECTRLNPNKRPADMSEVIRRLEVIQHGVQRQANARNSNVA